MVENSLKFGVIAMMLIAGIHAFDTYYEAGGATGYAVAGVDCNDADGGNPNIAGFTESSIYSNGFAADTCVGDDLLEFYCSGKGPDVRAVKCAKGCYAGACN
ncbi:hypothetical protein HYX10_06280 [Candidatus Woesearchaeota archaeon]|nr:hypothetical protein [Candidatus Woesearchaeota archaeon]